MKKTKLDKIFSAAAKAVVVIAIVVVFIGNVFPSADEAIILESIPPESVPSLGSAFSSSDTASSQESGDSENSSDSKSPCLITSASVQNEAPVELPEDPSESSSKSVPYIPVQSEKININTASLEQLKTLSGIGDVKAQAIIDYREKNCGFSSVDELVNVSGIGSKTLENIRDRITV